MKITRKQLRSLIVETLGDSSGSSDPGHVLLLSRIISNFPILKKALVKVVNHPHLSRVVNRHDTDLTEEINALDDDYDWNEYLRWDLMTKSALVETLGQLFEFAGTGAQYEDGTWEFEPFLDISEVNSIIYLKDLAESRMDKQDGDFIAGLTAAYYLKAKDTVMSTDELMSQVRKFDSYRNAVDTTSRSDMPARSRIPIWQ